MVPLVAYERELELAREMIERVARDARAHASYMVGTMIELPRACLQADRIAAATPTSSRSAPTTSPRRRSASAATTSRASVLGRYIDVKVLDRSPFETLDTPGVGQLIRMGAWLGRTDTPAAEAGRLRRARRRPRLDRVLRTPPASTTSRARPTGCRSRASPPPSRRSGRGRGSVPRRRARSPRARPRPAGRGADGGWRGRRALGDRWWS